MMDHYVWGAVSRISPEAPVPIVHVERESVQPGEPPTSTRTCSRWAATLYSATLRRDRVGRRRRIVAQATTPGWKAGDSC